MRRNGSCELHEKRKEFMFYNSPADRVVEDYYNGEFSEFLVKAGGDNLTFRVYGKTQNDFKIYER